MTSEKMVSIIILNWNSGETTINCLRSLKDNTDYKHYEVIVVDQGSVDGSREVIEKEFRWIKLIKNDYNTGFSGGNNIGMRESKGDYIIMLNNDTLVTKGWLKGLVELAESDETIAAVGPKLSDEGKTSKAPDRDVDTVCGAVMMMRRSSIDKIGMLDAENFSPIYGEENDWCYRAKNAGYRIVETSKVKVIHLGSVDTEKHMKSDSKFYLQEKHRIQAVLLNLPLRRIIKHMPGFGLIALRSMTEGKFFLLLRAYADNFFNMRRIIRERRKRKTLAASVRGTLEPMAVAG